MEMMSCKKAALKWNVSDRLVSGLCAKGEIPGAVKEGRSWLLPENAKKPDDKRIKNGEYRKKAKPSKVRSVKLSMPVGISDYRRAQQDYYYVDKTLLIRDFIDQRPQVTLFTRPRRFGKTLNMDMLRVFFEQSKEDTSVYFRDKKIWACGERYTSYQGKFPVIFLTFKDVKFSTWEQTLDKIKALLQAEYGRHMELQDSPALAEYEQQYFTRIINREASEVELTSALENLSLMLDEHYKKAPVIIIDEYDTPIQEGYSRDYYDQIISFMRNFFSGAFKDNPHLSYGFLTGILRIAQESIFSGLNNLTVNSVMDDEYSEYFGFTREEVEAITSYYNMKDHMEEILEWYDGYRFGKTEIFNPWSVINYVAKNGLAQAYWVNTGSNEILDDVLEKATPEIWERLQALMQGEKVLASIDMNAVYTSLGEDPSYIYSFLLVAGYLKAVNCIVQSSGYICEVAIPNKEISAVYRTEVIRHFMKAGMLSRSTAANITEALFLQDSEKLQKAFKSYLDKTISYFDAATEGFYHGMIIGIVALMDDKYKVLSNRESGDGRFDICLVPKAHWMPGILMEIKHVSGLKEKQLEDLALQALSQIDEKRYETDMKNEGIQKIVKYGIAFSGKQIRLADQKI